MSHRGRRRGRRGRGRPSIKRWGRREAERTSSQEGSTTGAYVLELSPREPPLQVAPPLENAPVLQTAPTPKNAPLPQVAPPLKNAPPPQTAPPPENVPPPQAALPPENALSPQTAHKAGLETATRMVLESLQTTSKQCWPHNMPHC